LEKRTYWHHGQAWYAHRNGKWEALGTDIAKANARAKVYNRAGRDYGTVAYWFRIYLAEAAAGRVIGAKGKPLAPRTIEDYTEYSCPLIAYFGKMFPADVRADHAVKYRRLRAQQGAPVTGNREKSACSALFTWLRNERAEAGVKLNPFHRTGRNRETGRSRYVEDAEHRAVEAIAKPMPRAAMMLVYRTLQRPDDVLGWDRRNVVTKTFAGVEKRVLRFVQSKTGKEMEIEISGELAELLDALPALQAPTVGVPLICTRRRRRYTVEGMGAMIRRYCKNAGVASFGLQDMKAKGATDMYHAGELLSKIKELCGHESETTTEVYIKRHMKTIATPNQRAIAGK
jgi:integrase